MIEKSRCPMAKINLLAGLGDFWLRQQSSSFPSSRHVCFSLLGAFHNCLSQLSMLFLGWFLVWGLSIDSEIRVDSLLRR